MDETQLIKLYPRLYHIAEDGSWPSIRQHGLLPTKDLAGLYGASPTEIERLTRGHRPTSVELGHPEHGTAVIRDQKPLHPAKLEACLTDMTVEEWLELLNGQVFFWLQQVRMEGMLRARPYRDRPHTILHVDTAALLAAHASQTRLCRINSGATLFRASARGSDSFKPIRDYPHRPREHPSPTGADVAELAVEGGVPDIADMVVRVERRQAGEGVLEVIEER